MSPPCPSPAPAKRTYLSENRGWFFFLPRLLLLATVNSAERIAAASARFLSPSHEEERTDADVNTGNDTNTNQRKKARKTGGKTRTNLRGRKFGSPSVCGGGRTASSAGRGKCEQTGEVQISRGGKKDRGNRSKRDKRKVETYNFSLALCDPRVLIQYREDLAKDPIKASPLLVSLRLGWQTKDHCCCGVYKNQVGTISC